MRILVTGAAGLTGGEVVRHSAARGHEVVGVVRNKDQWVSAPGAQVVVADCRDRSQMQILLSSCDAIIHVAGIHLGAAIADLPAFRTVPAVVAVSTAGIYSKHRRSTELYRSNEGAIRSVRPDAVIVRPTMIYGSPRDRNVSRVVSFISRFGFLPLVTDGSALVQPIHHADLAAALVRLVDVRANVPIDAGGPAPLSLKLAAEAIFDALRRPYRFLCVPLGPALAAARVVDAIRGSRWLERVLRTQENRSIDPGRLVALTGIRLRDFETGVREQVSITLRSGR